MENYDVRNLVLRFKQGDKQAFGQLYEMTKSGVYFMCCKYIGNEQEVQDIVSDTYLSAMKNIGSLQNPDYFVTWLNRIAINKCKDYLKRSKPVLFTETDEEAIGQIEVISETFLPESYIENSDRRRKLMEIIDNNLSDVQRMTVILFCYNGESIRNIAEIMECSEGTVKSRLNSAKKIIRNEIEKQGGKENFAVVGLPFLANLFRKEANEILVPNQLSQRIHYGIQNMAVQNINTNNSMPQNMQQQNGYANSGNVNNRNFNNGSINNNAVAPVAKKGMSLGLKVGIGVASVAVIAGVAITVAVLANKAPSATTSVPSSSYSSSSALPEHNSSTTGESSASSSSSANDLGYEYEFKNLTKPETVPNHKIESVKMYTKQVTEKYSRDVNAIQVTPDIEINFDKAKEKLETDSFYVNNCDFSYETITETQNPSKYDDQEELYTTYTLTEKMVAVYKDGSVDSDNVPQGVTLEVKREVADMTAPNEIALYIDGTPSIEKQELAYNLIKEIAGDEYAEYLVYDEIEKKENEWDYQGDKGYSVSFLTTGENDDQKVYTTLDRKISKTGLYYAVKINLDKNTFEAYSGDYKSIGSSFPVKLSDVLSDKVGETNFTDKFLDKYMKSLEEENLKYLLTYYEEDEVRYTQTTRANGEVESTITCQSAMGCEDVSKLLSPSVDIAVSALTNNNKTEINYLYISSSLGTQPKGEKQTQEELLEKGKKLVPVMIDGIDCSSIKYGKEPYTTEGKVKVMDKEMPYTLDFTIKASMADADYNVGNYELRIGNCPEEIWEE